MLENDYLKYVKGVYPEWIDEESRVAFAVEFDSTMFDDKNFFPNGWKQTESGAIDCDGALFETFGGNPWFWLDPEKDIVSYADNIGDLELEDAFQLPMEKPSPAWDKMIKELEEHLPTDLFHFTNVEEGHTLEEWEALFGNEELWDFTEEDLIRGAVELDPDMVYWAIDGRLYETLLQAPVKR